jgi:hypothetical protein
MVEQPPIQQQDMEMIDTCKKPDKSEKPAEDLTKLS